MRTKSQKLCIFNLSRCFISLGAHRALYLRFVRVVRIRHLPNWAPVRVWLCFKLVPRHLPGHASRQVRSTSRNSVHALLIQGLFVVCACRSGRKRACIFYCLLMILSGALTNVQDFNGLILGRFGESRSCHLCCPHRFFDWLFLYLLDLD